MTLLYMYTLFNEQVNTVQASITWKLCAKLPTKLDSGNATIINGKVYCGGGGTGNDDDQYIVYSYDSSQDNWTTLPPLPVEWFGLGQFNGKLVAVGGLKKSDGRQTNHVFTYDERSRKWRQTLPPMPTARYSSGILSLQSALVVAGGLTSGREYTDAVEIFKADTLQWYRTNRLPTACQNISLVVIGNTCYALGGYKSPSHLNQALYASVDDLLFTAVPANQTTHSGSSANTQSAWKTLANTPTHEPAAAVLAGKLLFIIGGNEMSGGRDESDDKKEVYMFSPSTNSWIYISDLPEPRSRTTVALLSSTEILVVGGWYVDGIVDTTYKGTLELTL